VSAAEREQITEHLIKHKVLMQGDVITGNAGAEGFFDDINPGKLLCQIGCDAAAAAAAQALTLTGPALAAALAAIAVARDACRNGC
jgi:orotate phosphoribosyltransferase